MIAAATDKLSTLGRIGKIARKVAGPLAAVGMFSVAQRGYAEGGALGAGNALMRDLVWADEVETVYGATAHAASDAIMPGNSRTYMRSHRSQLNELLEPYREK